MIMLSSEKDIYGYPTEESFISDSQKRYNGVVDYDSAYKAWVNDGYELAPWLEEDEE